VLGEHVVQRVLLAAEDLQHKRIDFATHGGFQGPKPIRQTHQHRNAQDQPPPGNVASLSPRLRADCPSTRFERIRLPEQRCENRSEFPARGPQLDPSTAQRRHNDRSTSCWFAQPGALPLDPGAAGPLLFTAGIAPAQEERPAFCRPLSQSVGLRSLRTAAVQCKSSPRCRGPM
jgi:hypothetical protein